MGGIRWVYIVELENYGGTFVYDNREAANRHVHDLGENEEHCPRADVNAYMVRSKYKREKE